MRSGANSSLVTIALALAATAACAGVAYQKPGQPIAPRAGETIVFGRMRFFYDEKEFYPFKATIDVFPMANSERHVWLRRVGEQMVSAELHPDGDGSLAIWLAHGDYALVGSNAALGAGTGAFYVVALFRVPEGAAAMDAGTVIFKSASHEGGYVAYGEFGQASVVMQPADSARAAIERKFATLPTPFVQSAWCAGDQLPDFDDADFTTRATALLDHGCGTQPIIP
jgi:hypothetical protein